MPLDPKDFATRAPVFAQTPVAKSESVAGAFARTVHEQHLMACEAAAKSLHAQSPRGCERLIIPVVGRQIAHEILRNDTDEVEVVTEHFPEDGTVKTRTDARKRQADGAAFQPVPAEGAPADHIIFEVGATVWLQSVTGGPHVLCYVEEIAAEHVVLRPVRK